MRERVLLAQIGGWGILALWIGGPWGASVPVSMALFVLINDHQRGRKRG